MRSKVPITIILTIIQLLLLNWKGSAQNLSNRGREFWVGYGHHQFMEPGQSNSQEMVLYFSAEQAARVTVSIKGRSATSVKVYTAPANTVISSDFMPKAGTLDCRLYDLPPSFGGTGGEGLYDLSIHIESDVPIVAYSHTFGSASSGASMLIPVEAYGHQYFSLNSTQVYANNCFSWAYVVAAYDNTVVEITPSVQTRLGMSAGTPFTVSLDKGQIYQVIGANLTGGSTSLELSGTKFRSIANPSGECYPIAVFSGSSRTSNPISCGSGGGDNDNQQCFPTQSWGKKYLLAPTSRSSAASQFMTNSYRVLVKDPTTVVKRNGIVLTGLQKNTFYFFESTTADAIEADKPIMVAQYMTGGSCLGGGLGDPEMIYVSPVEQGIKRVGFYRNTRESISVNYLTLVIPTSGVASLRIDGSPAFDHSYAHPNAPGYTVVVKRWTAQATQAKASSDSAFTAITYGLGSVESYGYNAGTYINNLNAVSGVQNLPDTAAKQHTYTCVNTPVKLSVLMAAYQPFRIDWNLSKLGSGVISPNANYTDNNPVPKDTVFVNGIKYWRYELPGTYTFGKSDTIFIPISSYHPTIENCYTREDLTIPVIVKAKPDADFSFVHSGCTKDTILFKAKDTTSNSYVVRDFKWTFPGGQQSDSFSVKRLYAPGAYDIKLSVVTRDGCASDTIKTITIGDKPPAGFITMPDAVCAGTGFQFKDTSSPGISVNRWYWSFGNGKDSVSVAGPTLQYVYPSPGVYRVRHASSSSPTCVSDTLEKQVTVYALPAVSFTNDANGCIAPAGEVRFTGTASSADGQVISAYAWQFGDANATAANPNTAAIKDPLHNFQAGSYNVKFSATTVNGCIKDTTMSIAFKLKPALAFAALTDICQTVASFSVAKGSVTNGLPGSFVYRGPGTSSDGKFDPKVAGPGTHRIWYEYTTNEGCSDSVSQTIKVSATPVASFSIPNSGCLPTNGRVLFNNTSTIADGQTLGYLWNFGDANAGGTNPNTSVLKDPSHDYAEGTYNIKLSVTSADGCSKDTAISATFALKPVINFTGLTAVCQESQAVDVAKASVTNGVTGTGIYRGPGTTAAGSFSPAAAGAGTHTIWFVYSTAGGCIDSVSQTIKVHATPMVSFSVAGGACLAPNGRVQFVNATTVADLQALDYLWNFGDANAGGANANSSTLKDPSHDYKEGTFNIKLTASTANGCMKDTTISMKFALKPILAFAPLTPICQDAAAVTITEGTATNGVTGTGIYRGPGTSANGRFDPLVSGYGTHTIWYVFTTTGGCTDSISQTIEVFPRPASSFNATSAVCVDNQVTITNTSTIPTGGIGSWQWDLGDGSTPVYQNGNVFNKVYTNAGTYKITLVTKSLLGCISLPAEQTVLVSPDPVANFTLPAAVCFPGNPVVMTNTSTVADNSVLSHSWNYGDGSPLATTVNGSRIYAATGSYSIKLTTVSAKGCSHDTTKVFNAFFGKPVARFTLSAADICQGVESQFSDASTDVGSSITARSWSFGDGSSSALADPKKRYNSPGRYTVTLTATNAAGCASDPFSQQVNVFLQPVVDAGPSFVVPQGSVVNFLSVANDPGLVFLWTPTPDLTPASLLRASVTALQDQVYRLTATGQNGCTATDTVSVKILKTVKIPNVFSPNGDGVNDRWNIENMADYPGCTLQVFNRYGQLVYSVAGYNTPWDGKVNGKDLPVGVYYYVINLKNGFKPINGSITIIR